MINIKDKSSHEAVVNPNWWKSSVFYQIYPRSFFDSSGDGIGDLPGIIARLDYLNDGTPQSLGIDAIWFSPFFTSPDYDYGYDIADYLDVDPRYGTLSDFDRLLAEAHKRKIRVILDLVVNHTSCQHQWFLESRSSRDNPKRDWYIWRDGRGLKKQPPNNWRNSFFGPAWTWDEETEQYYLHSFLKEQPDLNWSNPEVRAAIEKVIRFWLDRGVDGFRLDVPHIYCKDEQLRNNPSFLAFFKEGGKLFPGDRTLFANLVSLLSLPELQIKKYNHHQPETHQVLKEFRQIFNSYQAVTSAGETIGEDPDLIASYYGENNDELHMNFYFELLYCRWKAGAFRRCIDRWEKSLPRGAWPAYFLSNHDRVRAAGRYDQGERGKRQARLLALMLLTLRGTPFVYYGEEVAMMESRLGREEMRDPFGIRWYPLYRGRDGCRTPMQWDDSPYAGFSENKPWLPVGPEHDKRNVAIQEQDRHSHLNLVKKVIWMRKDMPALLEGRYESLVEGVPSECFVYSRKTKEHANIIALNFSDKRQTIDLKRIGGADQLLLSTDPARKLGPCSEMLSLEPDEGCLFNSCMTRAAGRE